MSNWQERFAKLDVLWVEHNKRQKEFLKSGDNAGLSAEIKRYWAAVAALRNESSKQSPKGAEMKSIDELEYEDLLLALKSAAAGGDRPQVCNVLNELTQDEFDDVFHEAEPSGRSPNPELLSLMQEWLENDAVL